MIKHYIKTYLDTILCRFSSKMMVENSKVNRINYDLGCTEQDNRMKISGSIVKSTKIEVKGIHNAIIMKKHANVAYSNIKIEGNNNTVILDGCVSIIDAFIKGNNCTLSIGKGSLIDESTQIFLFGQNNSIEIGEECMFADNVEIWASDTHLITDLEGNPLNPSKPVKIGNHVWLGRHVKVMKGTTIGEHSVVGLGSIVSKDIPDHCIAVGTPAKVVKNGITWKFGHTDL